MTAGPPAGDGGAAPDRGTGPGTVEVVWGTAEGETPLSAFDRALSAGGIHDYNLVRLSSVVPPDATVIERGTAEREWPVGQAVAAVVADAVGSVSGETVVAGLGWATSPEGGVFMEHTADSRDECETLLRRGVRDAMAHRDRTWDGEVNTRLVEHVVDRTGAAVVAAVYAPVSLTWDG